MKKFTKFLFLTLASVLILSGCSIEPRVYMSGYNIKWNSKFKHQVKQQNKDENAIVKTKAPEIIKTANVTEPVTPSLLESNAKNEPVKQAKTDKYRNTLVASTTGKKYVAPKEKTGLTTNPAPEVKNPNKLKSKIQKISKKFAAAGGDHKGKAIAGFILSLLGAIFVFIVFPVSILFGIFGVLFSALGMRDAKIIGLIGLILGILDILFPVLLLTILIHFLI